MKKYGLTTIAVATIAILILTYVFYPRGLQLFQHYFFFQDSDFSLVHDSKLDKWREFGCNYSQPFNYTINLRNGGAILFYNESSGI